MSRNPYTPEEGSLAYRICLLAAADRYARLRPSNLAAKLQVPSGNIGPSARAAVQHGWLARVAEGHTFALTAGPNMPDPWPAGSTPAAPPPSYIGLEPAGRRPPVFRPESSPLPPAAPAPKPQPVAEPLKLTAAGAQKVQQVISRQPDRFVASLEPRPAPRAPASHAVSRSPASAAFDLDSVRITTAPKPGRRGGVPHMSRYDAVLERLPVGGVAEEMPPQIARGLISRMKRRGMAHSSRTNADGTISVWRDS